MNLSKLETFAVVESVTFEGTSVSVNPGTKVTSIVPSWGRMEVTSLEVSEGHLCVTIADFPFESLQGTGSLVEVLSLIGNKTKIIIVGDGFTISGRPEPIKPLVRGLLGREVDNCFGLQAEDDDGDEYININLKSPERKE